MAKEIIDAIRTAETEAAKMAENAEQEAQRILREARMEAEALKKNMIKKAQEEAEQARKETREACWRKPPDRNRRRAPGCRQSSRIRGGVPSTPYLPGLCERRCSRWLYCP